MVTNINLTPVSGECGMSVPVKGYHAGAFQRVARVLVRDAINTLTLLDRPVTFELYWDPRKGVAGWRA